MPDFEPAPDTAKKDTSEKLSDRRFRRYHRAAARRKQAAREDSHFFRAVFSIAGLGAALAIGLAVYFVGGGSDLSGLEALARPWLGPMSKLEVMGVGVIAALGVLFLWRVRKR